MSAINSLGGSSNPTSAGGTGLSALSSDEFLNIILTELQAQDPLEPQDTEALLNQFSTLYQIESDIKLSENLGELVNQNEFTAASLLIGSLVSGISIDNRRVADVVVSVTNTADGPVLNLFDGSRVSFSNIDEVAGAVNLGDGSDDGADGASGDSDDSSGDDATEPTISPDGVDGAGSDSSDDSSSSDAAGAVETRSTTGDRIDQLVQKLKEQFE
ncbi:MAG: flagellar hook capping FlgD N-terminal domain-containing protein [Phycisphaerales bacterium]